MDDDLINSKKITKTNGEYGVIRRIKWCKNYWNTKIEYDLDNICTGRTIEKNITVGDTGLFSYYDEHPGVDPNYTKTVATYPGIDTKTTDCVEIQLKRPGECIKDISFFAYNQGYGI
jgi:hypothetical protein